MRDEKSKEEDLLIYILYIDDLWSYLQTNLKRITIWSGWECSMIHGRDGEFETHHYDIRVGSRLCVQWLICLILRLQCSSLGSVIWNFDECPVFYLQCRAISHSITTWIYSDNMYALSTCNISCEYFCMFTSLFSFYHLVREFSIQTKRMNKCLLCIIY